MAGNISGNYCLRHHSSKSWNPPPVIYGVDIGTARINGVNFSGNGAMAAYNSKVVTGDTVKGRFFGVNAKTLAGMVTFKGKRQYDTAFGDAKQTQVVE